MNKILKKIVPSFLSVNQKKIDYQLKQIKHLKLKNIHCDIMDGIFVSNFFLINHSTIKKIINTNLLIDLHLMVANPKKWIKKYKKFAIDSISFHLETQPINETIKLLKLIHKNNIKAGIVVKMETDLSKYQLLANKCESITVMAVNPGKGGQKYCSKCLKNLQICQNFKKINPQLKIKIDGGVNENIIKTNTKYVDYFISGNWFFEKWLN